MTHPEKIRALFLARLTRAGVNDLDYYALDREGRRKYVREFREFIYDTPHLDPAWLGEILGIKGQTPGNFMQRHLTL